MNVGSTGFVFSSFGELVGLCTGHVCYYAELVQLQMAAACVEGSALGDVPAASLVTCSVHGRWFTLQGCECMGSRVNLFFFILLFSFT